MSEETQNEIEFSEGERSAGYLSAAIKKSDPRQGLPSASGLYRLRNCPGSYRMEREAITRNMAPPDDSEAAASGTRIHRWLETEADEDWQALSYAEQETAARCQSQAGKVIAGFAERYGMITSQTMERRFVMNAFGVTGEMPTETPWPAPIIGSGQADRMAFCGWRHILILDYKTGRGDVTPAESNDQLRGLAPMVSFLQPETVTVAIVAPLSGQPTVAEFSAESLKVAKNWLVHTWLQAPHATETAAGPWCQYCPGRLICGTYAAHNAATLAPLTQDGLPDGKVKEAMFARAYESDATTLAEMGERVKMLEWGAAAIKSAIRKRLEEGGAGADELKAVGWLLKEEGGAREITDPDKAAQLLAPLLAGAEGGATAALMRAAKLSAATLTEELHKASGKKNARQYNITGKEAKELLAQTLGALITQKPRTKLVHGKTETEETEIEY